MQKIGPLLITGLVIVTLPATAQVQPAVNPEAMKLLKQSANYIKQQPSYEFATEITFDDVMVPDFKVQYHANSRAWVRRPNQVRVDYTGDRRNVNFFYDGKAFTMLDKQTNVFATIPAPATIDATLAAVQSKYGVVIPLDDFLMSDPYQAIASRIKSAYYLGKSTVAGVPVHHLAFSQPDVDWQIWIQAGSQPLPRKLVITYKNLPGSPQYTAVFTDWQFKPIANSAFSFIPPANASAIEFIPATTQSGR